MSQRIVRTLDNKMLQDTSAGVLLLPFRPYLVQNNGFIEGRLSKNDHRPKELEILAEEKDLPKGLTDALLEQAFENYKAEKLEPKTSSATLDFADFVANLSTYMPKAKAAPAAAAKPAGK